MQYIFMSLLTSIYFLTGIGLTCFNKWLLHDRYYNFPFPITLILCHMISNFIFAALTIRLCLYQRLQSSIYFPTNLTLSTFFTRFVPIGVLFAADITLTNVSFKYVPVSLTEVVKSGVPMGLMITNMITQREPFNLGKMFVCIILSIGIALTSYGELQFHWIGFLAAVGAMFSGIIKFVLLEKLLLETEEQERNSEQTTSIENHQQTQSSQRTAARSINRGLIHSHSATALAGLNQPIPLRSIRMTPSPTPPIPVRNSKSQRKPRKTTNLEDGDTENIELVNINKQQNNHLQHNNHLTQQVLVTTNTGVSNKVNEGREASNSNDPPPTSSPLRKRSPSSSRMSSISNGKLPTLQLPSAKVGNPNSFSQTEPLEKEKRRIPLAMAISPITVTPVSRTLSLVSAHRLHPMLSLFYFSPVAAFILMPTFVLLEYAPLVHPDLTHLSHPDFLGSQDLILQTAAMILSGAFLAFGLNASELFVIQITSALTLCIIATVKFLLVLLITNEVFDHPMSITNIIGCMISVCGIAGYNAVKYYEMTQNEQQFEILQEETHTNTTSMNGVITELAQSKKDSSSKKKRKKLRNGDSVDARSVGTGIIMKKGRKKHQSQMYGELSQQDDDSESDELFDQRDSDDSPTPNIQQQEEGEEQQQTEEPTLQSPTTTTTIAAIATAQSIEIKV